MTEFTTKVDLLNSSAVISELKVKHFKVLLKTLLGDKPNIEDVFTNVLNICKDTTRYSIDELKKLSVIDFLLIILYLRCVSIGNNIQLELIDETNTKIVLNLYKVIENLKQPLNFKFKQVIENIKIEYQILSIYDFVFLNVHKNELLDFKKYIKKIIFTENDHIDVQGLNNNEFLNLFKALPANYSVLIFEHILTLSQQLQQINLLEHLTHKNLSLYLNQNTFAFILQILFSKNLLPLYENVFALAKFANISPEYIENCTPGEYTIFVKLLERILKEQTTQKQANSLPPINESNPKFM
jgi:hypothetical protein